MEEYFASSTSKLQKQVKKEHNPAEAVEQETPHFPSNQNRNDGSIDLISSLDDDRQEAANRSHRISE